MLTTLREERRGFALMLAISLIAVLAILAALIIPATSRTLAEERIGKAQTTIAAIDSAIHRFRNSVLAYPGKLNHMVTPITTNDKNSCGNNYSNANVSRWGGTIIDTIGGAYLAQSVPAGGLPIAGGFGTIRDSVSRNPNSASGMIELVMFNVGEEDAILLNDKIDGLADFVAADEVTGDATGKLTWTAPDANRNVTVTYNMTPPINGC